MMRRFIPITLLLLALCSLVYGSGVDTISSPAKVDTLAPAKVETITMEVGAAINFDATRDSESCWGSSLSWSHPIGKDSGNGRFLVAVCSHHGATSMTIGTATYNSVSATSCYTQVDQSTNHASRVCYWLDANLPSSAGSYSLACSFDKSATLLGMSASFDGVEQAAPDDYQYASTSGGASGTISDVVTTQVDDSWVVLLEHRTYSLDYTTCNGYNTFDCTNIQPDYGETERNEECSPCTSTACTAIATEVDESYGGDTYGYEDSHSMTGYWIQHGVAIAPQ